MECLLTCDLRRDPARPLLHEVPAFEQSMM